MNAKVTESQLKVIDGHLFTGTELLGVTKNRGGSVSVWIKTPAGKLFMEIGKRGRVYGKTYH